MEFTYSFYSQLINSIRENDYQVCSYHNYEQFNKPCILRHDVDNSLEKALEFAKLESELGVVSTYFILLSTDFYNISSRRSLDIINEIKSLGHDVGLHFDELKYDDNVDVVSAIKQECKIMSLILDTDINSVSMHRPSKKTLDASYKIDGIVNSYDKIFFNDFKYISDSRRNWRENPFEAISENHNKLHILTHSFWYNEKDININDRVSNFVNNANNERYLSMKENIRDLNEIMLESSVK